MQYRQAANNTLQLPCNEIARLFESDSSVQPRLADVFEISLAHTMITEQLGTDARDLAEMTGPTLNDTRQKFSALDREIMALDARRISAKASRRPIDIGSDQGPKSGWTELSLIENEVKKKKRHLPLRDLIKRSNKALRSLKPVWLMSPLSAAQYLPRESDFFDLVVIDEASQMKPADAIGSIARARQVIVVGDPMQLPPTDFFGASAGSVEGQEGAASDQSSILDLAEARLRRRRMLRWHYRSRHESLIAFSNKHFYQSRLVVFPAATKSVDLGVEQIYVGGRYITGGTNPDEAKAVIEQARQMIDQFPNLSIGIVTTNGDQRELVLEEFEKLSADNRDVASYRAKWQSTLEPIFIKNLENVQGDERDIILISTVFGPDESGRVAQRFGPINSASGHRRLNVLFTRAKRKLIIVTSLKSADIIPGNSTNEGVHILKQFLEFSKTGRIETGVVSDGEPDSDFEVHVAQMLRQAGYEAVPQVGVHGFRIDIGVRHASFPDGFLAGIECDGATYHSGVTVRDRDRLRQEMLEGLGWQLYRIWSTDWFTNPEKEMQRLVAWLEALRDVKATTTSMVKVA